MSTHNHGEAAPSGHLPTPRQSVLWLLLFAVLFFAGPVLYFGLYTVVSIAQQPELMETANAQSVLQQRIGRHAGSPAGMTGAYLAYFVLFMPFLLWAAHFKQQSWQETLGLNPFRLKSLGVWLAVLAAYFLLQVLINGWFQIPPSDFLKSLAGTKHLPLTLVIVLLTPLVEEWIFRGYLFRAWRHTRLGLSGTLLLTSTLFTLMHWGQYHWVHIVFLFALSVILGLAREKTGSTWVPTILHGANNLVAAIVVIYLGWL